YLNKGNRFINSDQGMNMMMDKVPAFDLQFANFQGKSVRTVPDSTFTHNSSTVSVDIVMKGVYKNIDKINVYNNGKIIKQESFDEEVAFRGSQTKRSTELNLVPQNNVFEFSLTTKEGVTT